MAAIETAQAAGTATKKALKGVSGLSGGLAISFGMNLLTGEPFGDALKHTFTRDLGQLALWSVAPGVSLALAGAQIGVGIGKWAYKTARQFERSNKARRSGAMNFSYQDTEQAATMRQSAVQAIQQSQLNARTALGKEAQLMHRGISRYRRY